MGIWNVPLFIFWRCPIILNASYVFHFLSLIWCFVQHSKLVDKLWLSKNLAVMSLLFPMLQMQRLVFKVRKWHTCTLFLVCVFGLVVVWQRDKGNNRRGQRVSPADKGFYFRQHCLADILKGEQVHACLLYNRYTSVSIYIDTDVHTNSVYVVVQI